jgi:hypothetical protein
VIGEDGDLEKQRNDLDAERRAFSEATQRLGEERRRLEVSQFIPLTEGQLISGRTKSITRGKEEMGRRTLKRDDIANSQAKIERSTTSHFIFSLIKRASPTTITLEIPSTSIPIPSISLGT